MCDENEKFAGKCIEGFVKVFIALVNGELSVDLPLDRFGARKAG